MKQFYFKSILLSLLMIVSGLGSASAEDTWVKTDPADLVTGDVVMIVDLSTRDAMSNDKGTSSAPASIYVYFSEDKSECTGTKDNIVPDNLQWVVTHDENGYKFGVSGTSNYLYCTNTNNGVRVGTNSNNVFVMKVADANSNEDFLFNNATSRYLGVYIDQDWRCYTGVNSNIKSTVTAFYKKVESSTPSDATLTGISLSGYTEEFNVGDEFSFGGTVTATYDDESSKTVTSKAVFSEPDMTTEGRKEVTVSYSEGGVTKEATYYITVNPVSDNPNTDYYEKVTTAPSDWSGEYLIVYDEGSVAFNGALETLDAANNTIEVVMDYNKIAATNAVKAAAFTIAKMEGADTYSIRTASGKYIGVSSNSNGLKTSDDPDTYAHTISISGGEVVIAAVFDGSTMTLRFNSGTNERRFRYYKSGQKPVQLYKKTVTLDNQYTLVTVGDDGETETAFEGNTLTKELPAQTKFYIKDNNDKVYYAIDDTEKSIISAENHENLPTYESGNKFYLKKANTWVFTITELETAEGITLTVTPETAGETKYMISQSVDEESGDVFDENLQLTKEMDTTPFYITRSDDYGIFELSAVRRTNPEGYTRFTFTEEDNTAAFEAGKRLNMYEMSEAGTYTFTIDLTDKTVTAEKTTNDLYVLVTNVSELAEGDKVIIVNYENNKAMSTTQNSNNRGATDVTFDKDDKAVVPSTTDIQVFTLEGNAEGWYFNTGSGYIYAASGSSNHLKTETERDDNAKAVITIADEGTSVVFQRPNGRNTLQYNPNNGNPLFTCYASASQKAVQINRLVNENDVTLTISSVGYATLYYSDRALRVPSGVTAKTYTVSGGKLAESKTYEAGAVIPAGEAVVLKGKAGEYKFMASTTTGEKDASSMLKGSDEAELTTGGTYYYALQPKKVDGTGGPGFYWMNGTGAAFTNGAHKAYMALDKKFSDAQEVGGAKSFYLFEDVATGIDSTQAGDGCTSGQRFNMSGQRVGSSYKGIVIVNGKKFMQK